MSILIGADPEVFALKGGELVSAHNMIPGTKKEPFKVKAGAVQVDGMALEFNIDPARHQGEFVYNLQTVMKELRRMVPGVQLLAEPVAEFGKEMIDAQPAEAKELGCDPDFNAWRDGAVNKVPDVNAPFRTGSGHIHIGLWDPNGPLPVNAERVQKDFVKQLDVFLAAPFSFVDRDMRRRELYGKAGAYRPKPYGVEYRVLSNKWLSSPSLMRWVYSNTMAAVRAMRTGDAYFRWHPEVEDMVNDGDLEGLARMLKDTDIEVPYGYRGEVQKYAAKEWY